MLWKRAIAPFFALRCVWEQRPYGRMQRTLPSLTAHPVPVGAETTPGSCTPVCARPEAGAGAVGQLSSVSLLLLLAPVGVTGEWLTIPVSLGPCALWRWRSCVLAHVSAPSSPGVTLAASCPRGLPEQRASPSLMLRGQEGETGPSGRGWGIRRTCGAG